MAVDAVTSVVIQKLTDMLIEESAVFDKVIDQVEEIRIQLREMRGILMDAEKKQDKHKVVKDWVQSYLHTLYSMEDAVETFVLRIACRGCREKGCFFWAGRVISALFDDLAGARKLRWEMMKISHEIDRLKDKPPRVVHDTSFKQPSRGVPEEPGTGDKNSDSGGDVYRRNRSSESISRGGGSSFKGVPRSKPISSYCVRESSDAAPGIESDTEKELVDKLTVTGEDSGRRLISIVGARGSGKTTLVRKVYNSRRIKLHFKHRAWVFISKEKEEDTCRSLLVSILKQITKGREQWFLTQEQLVTRVSDHLKAERYLLVMDDIRTPEVWERLKAAFPVAETSTTMGAGSRVIFTTHREAKFKFSDEVIPQRPLDEEDAWGLFVNKLGMTARASASLPAELPRKRILKICNGSPLSISLLSGVLSARKVVSYDEWSRVLDAVESQLAESESGSDLLPLSYDDLPFHSKLCLLYLGLFPKEFDIPVRRLFRLWQAEGFLKRSPGKSPEDLAEEYFNDLVYRNLIQLSKVRSVGNPKKCRMPGFVYDKLFSKAQDVSLFHVHDATSRSNSDFSSSFGDDYSCSEDADAPPVTAAGMPPFGVRRIADYADISTYYDSDSSPNIDRLRSYLSFNTQKKDTPAEGVGTLLDKMVRSGRLGLLRVLDLEGVYKPSLPDKLGDLFHLRYLGLRWTFLDKLPDSVGKLPYLETLDLKHTYINSIPNSIWNLKHLRHLNLNETRLDMPKNSSSLAPLVTLWGLFVDNRSLISDGLNRLRDLRELGITCRGLASDTDVENLGSWIAGLKALQSLRLRSTMDEAGRPGKLCVKRLSDLKRLSHLYLLGHLRQLPGADQFPTTSLKVLTLSLSNLEADPMPTLGQLPSLRVLRLFAQAYVGRQMVCHVGGFAELRVLKLWMLRGLEDWVVKDSAMMKLEKLEIRGCHRLRQLPSKLLELTRFEDLILTAMPEEFIKRVKENIPQRISLTDNSHWDFSPPPPYPVDARMNHDGPAGGQ